MIKFTTPYQVSKAALVGGILVLLAACQGPLDGINQKANKPVPNKLVAKMKSQGMTLTSPIMMRIFKEENQLEVWKRRNTGRYGLLATYEICKWSGKPGPKFKEGDRQAPEGYYNVNRHQMNPNSEYHLAFNMGFPNAYDRSHGRTGSHLMVHGACSSAGCYSMTDERIEEIYALARDAFKGGQKAFQVQAYPFRPTTKNMVKNRDNKHFEFWKMLKKGYDHFEITRVPPKVDVCEKRYEFNTESSARYPSSGRCPKRTMPASLATAYVKQQNKYNVEFEKLVAKSQFRKSAPIQPLTIEQALPGVTVPNRSNVIKPVVLKQPAPSSTDTAKSLLKPAG
ncbi:MAG: L,D-transpeptidase family protein [Rhizobiaceae bacterium]